MQELSLKSILLVNTNFNSDKITWNEEFKAHLYQCKYMIEEREYYLIIKFHQILIHVWRKLSQCFLLY